MFCVPYTETHITRSSRIFLIWLRSIFCVPFRLNCDHHTFRGMLFTPPLNTKKSNYLCFAFENDQQESTAGVVRCSNDLWSNPNTNAHNYYISSHNASTYILDSILVLVSLVVRIIIINGFSSILFKCLMFQYFAIYCSGIKLIGMNIERLFPWFALIVIFICDCGLFSELFALPLTTNKQTFDFFLILSFQCSNEWRFYYRLFDGIHIYERNSSGFILMLCIARWIQ